MVHAVAVAAVLALLAATCLATVPGGWTTRDPQSSPKYINLAHYAVAQHVEGLQYYDTVFELTKVETQVVAGVNYRLTFTTAPTDCKIGEDEYTREWCPAKENKPKETCTAVVYEKAWENCRTLTSIDCQ